VPKNAKNSYNLIASQVIVRQLFSEWEQYQIELDALTPDEGDAAAEKHFRRFCGEVSIEMPIKERTRRRFNSAFRCLNPGLGSLFCDFIRKCMSYVFWIILAIANSIFTSTTDSCHPKNIGLAWLALTRIWFVSVNWLNQATSLRGR
jgi:hypothetical protein